jgi:hypothetical protein
MAPLVRERRLAAATLWGSLAITVRRRTGGTELSALWSTPAWTLLPVVLL